MSWLKSKVKRCLSCQFEQVNSVEVSAVMQEASVVGNSYQLANGKPAALVWLSLHGVYMMSSVYTVASLVTVLTLNPGNAFIYYDWTASTYACHKRHAHKFVSPPRLKLAADGRERLNSSPQQS